MQVDTEMDCSSTAPEWLSDIQINTHQPNVYADCQARISPEPVSESNPAVLNVAQDKTRQWERSVQVLPPVRLWETYSKI